MAFMKSWAFKSTGLTLLLVLRQGTTRKQSKTKVAEDLLSSKGVVEQLSLEDMALLPTSCPSQDGALTGRVQPRSGKANAWYGTSPFVFPHPGLVWPAPGNIVMVWDFRHRAEDLQKTAQILYISVHCSIV